MRFSTLYGSMDAVGVHAAGGGVLVVINLHTLETMGVLKGTELSFFSFLLLFFVLRVAVMLLFRFIGLDIEIDRSPND
jgi:hypothetical protein